MPADNRTPTLPRRAAGDVVYVLHAEQLAGDEEAVDARKRLVSSVFEWQQGSSAVAAPLVNVVCDMVLGTSSEWQWEWKDGLAGSSC